MALSTARIHKVRGRPPLLAAGITSLIHSHSSSVRSLGYIVSFISPCYTTPEDFSDRLLENALLSFMAGLLVFLKTKVSLDCLLKLLFERSGARMETAPQVVYWINTTGLSVPYHRLLAEVVDGLCAMDL